MELIAATFSDGVISVTLFRDDIARMAELDKLPDFLNEKARQEFLASLARRAVFADTGASVVEVINGLVPSVAEPH